MENKLKDRGIGEWLILRYLPVSLFSLRMTHATSKGGKTLLVPTPYAFKMTMLDACFRAFEGVDAENKAREVFKLIKRCEVRFSPPPVCIVQNTFVKIRQEERNAPKGYYVPTIAYREFCFFNNGELKIALGIRGFSDDIVTLLKHIAFHINCIGKRGSFWQYIGNEIHHGDLSDEFTRPNDGHQLSVGSYRWSHELDDFGEALCEAKDGFDRVSTYSEKPVQLNKNRVLVTTLIPYEFQQSSRHFTQYIKSRTTE